MHDTQFGQIVPDFEQDSSQGRIRFPQGWKAQTPFRYVELSDKAWSKVLMRA